MDNLTVELGNKTRNNLTCSIINDTLYCKNDKTNISVDLKKSSIMLTYVSNTATLNILNDNFGGLIIKSNNKGAVENCHNEIARVLDRYSSEIIEKIESNEYIEVFKIKNSKGYFRLIIPKGSYIISSNLKINLSQLKHVGIVEYRDVYRKDKDVYILHPMLPTLSMAIQKCFLTDMEIRCVMRQICVALKYIHSCNIVHGNIQSKNIYIDGENVKIGGFEFANFLDHGGVLGYPSWSIFHNYGTDFDIWSLSFILFEYCGIKIPKANVMFLTDMPTNFKITTQSDIFKDFVSKCYQSDPTKRATADELLQHEFFIDSDNPKLISNIKVDESTITDSIFEHKLVELKKPSYKHIDLDDKMRKQIKDDIQKSVNEIEQEIDKKVSDIFNSQREKLGRSLDFGYVKKPSKTNSEQNIN
jgi:serine/threonine protein kinase